MSTETKPKLWFAKGVWLCSNSYNSRGVGRTPADAYRAWENEKKAWGRVVRDGFQLGACGRWHP